jgi:hypothetical protein
MLRKMEKQGLGAGGAGKLGVAVLVGDLIIPESLESSALLDVLAKVHKDLCIQPLTTQGRLH